MLLEFKQTMDKHSLDIIRDGKGIGYLQWHSYRENRIVLREPLESLSIFEMIDCLEELNKRNLLNSRSLRRLQSF